MNRSTCFDFSVATPFLEYFDKLFRSWEERPPAILKAENALGTRFHFASTSAPSKLLLKRETAAGLIVHLKSDQMQGLKMILGLSRLKNNHMNLLTF